MRQVGLFQKQKHMETGKWQLCTRNRNCPEGEMPACPSLESAAVLLRWPLMPQQTQGAFGPLLGVRGAPITSQQEG